MPDYIVFAQIRIDAEDADGAEEIVRAALNEAEELMGTESEVTGVELADGE